MRVANRLPPLDPFPPSPGPVQVLCGSALCDLRVWTEEEWAALPLADRPADHKHAPGLGWVGAVSRLLLN